MKKKSYNYKIVIGIIIGFLLVSMVYASGNILSSNVIYSSSNSVYSTGDVQGAIDDLKDKIDIVRPESCVDGYYCREYKTTLELGDYVYYKPEKTSYEIDTSITGYTGTRPQTINPSELDLWRVFNINDDGTVELISEYVSSTDVYFSSQTGYLNFVGYLNELAKQYKTEGITSGSRHFGYNGQTEYLDSNKVVFDSAPWECYTGGSCDNPPVESEGGGDKLYEKDYNQLLTALGNRVAKKVGTETATDYWMASRYYNYNSSDYYAWYGRNVRTSGSSSTSNLYIYSSSGFASSSISNALRPIVTLSSELSYGEGLGTKDSPMKIITG